MRQTRNLAAIYTPPSGTTVRIYKTTVQNFPNIQKPNGILTEHAQLLDFEDGSAYYRLNSTHMDALIAIITAPKPRRRTRPRNPQE